MNCPHCGKEIFNGKTARDRLILSVYKKAMDAGQAVKNAMDAVNKELFREYGVTLTERQLRNIINGNLRKPS